MAQKNGKRKTAFIVMLAIVGIGTAAYCLTSPYVKRKPSATRYVSGYVEGKPAGFWIDAKYAGQIESEMLLIKEKSGDSTVLRLTSPTQADDLFYDTAVVRVQTLIQARVHTK